MMLFEFFFNFTVGKDFLHAALRVVKVALNRADADVCTLLGSHLQFLHGAYAVNRVKHQNLRIRHITEAFERRFAGVAGSGNQNHYFGILARLRSGNRQQIRQQLQRHILKRAGRTAPKLQNACGIV